MFYLILNDILWRSWSFFLTVALFFLVLCLANSSFLVFLNSQFYLYNPLICWTLPGFFLYYYPCTLLRQWVSASIGLILFVSFPSGIIVLYSLMPTVLKIVSCICSLLQIGGKSFLCYSILSKCLVFDVLIFFVVTFNLLHNFVFLCGWS